jgi:hypothetical protein
MSELITYRLVVTAGSVARIWTDSPIGIFSNLGLRLDQSEPAPCAVTSIDGNSLTWFDSGAAAWAWLRDHDGLIAFWGFEDVTVGFAVNRELNGALEGTARAEMSLSVDLLSRDADEDKKMAIAIVERVAVSILDECDIVRAVAYDEEVSLPFIATDSFSGLPEQLGFWNAFPLEKCYENLPHQVEVAGGQLEERARAIVVRFSVWPWEIWNKRLPRLTDLLCL